MKNYGSKFAQKVWQSAMLIRTQTYISWCLLIVSLPMVANSGDEYVLEMGVYAQQEISGSIKDTNGNPLPGVNIVVKGTSNGTQSDFDGNYSITASSGDVLEFTFVGMAAKQVTVGSNTTIDVILEEDASELDEIVVIGYGSQRKSDLTGAVSQVKASSFEEQPVTRVEEALQGRAAGAIVSRANGTPGAAVKVRVRGVNSITGNNDPLVVVDGIFGGDLRTINPNDIASIEVLKDASALAIYGSRGSNGVILVTTKKGRGKTAIDLDVFTSISTKPGSIDRISSAQFARIKNEENPGTYSDAEIAELERNPIDYEDQLLRQALAQNLQLSVRGGSENVNYFVSGNYVNQEGIIITNEYERYSLRTNVNANLNDKVSLGLNLYGSRETGINNPDNFNRFKGSVLLKALTWDPTAPVRDENGNLVLMSPRDFAHNRFNPITALNRSNRERVADRFNANFDFKYKITDHFSYNLLLGASTVNQNIQSFIVDGDTSIDGSRHTDVNFSNNKNTSYQLGNIFNYNNSFSKHNLDLTGVYEVQGSLNKFNGYFTFDVNAPNFYTSDIGQQDRENFFNNGNRSTIESLLGRLNYNFDQSLYLTGSIRVDKSSKFAEDNNTGYFPSFAAAYSFNNLLFIESSAIVSNLKLRAGWGQVGNENILSDALFSSVNNGNYSFDGVSATPSENISRIGNPDLRWETTTQTNVGFDLGFLQNRFNLSFDYFTKTTEDLLLETPVQLFPGVTQFQNIGEVKNQGFDITLSGNIIENDNLIWNSSVVISKVTNEVTELYNNLDEIQGRIGSIDGTGNNLNIIQKGEPLGQFYGYTYLGVWQSTDAIPIGENGTPIAQPGDSKFLTDENGNRILGAIGNGIPTLTWGFNNTINYKNWDFNVFVQAAHDFDVYNLLDGAIHGGTGDYRDNLSLDALRGWTAENETNIPRNGSVNLLNSSRYVEDGSYIRLSNLTVGYTLQNLLKGIATLKLYASGQNLFLITDYSGYDPEVTSSPVNPNVQNQSDLGAGINVGAIPNPRIYTVGMKVGF